MSTLDLPAVAANELGAYSHPWTLGQLSDSLAAGHGCWVAEAPGADAPLVGHGVLMKGVDEVHLLNLTVRRDHQRRGLGRWMLERIVQTARASGAAALWLEVRASNEPALSLYASTGLLAVGRRPGYYPALRGREDAVLMSLNLSAADHRDGTEPTVQGRRAR